MKWHDALSLCLSKKTVYIYSFVRPLFRLYTCMSISRFSFFDCSYNGTMIDCIWRIYYNYKDFGVRTNSLSLVCKQDGANIYNN